MPTEDVQAESIWTLPTLKILVDERTAELRILIDERTSEFRNVVREQIAFRDAFINQMDRRVEQRFEATREHHIEALSAMDRAVTKAEQAADRRFELLNEFRGTLADQQARLIPRVEAEQRFTDISAAVRRLEQWQLTQAGAQAEHKGHEQQQQGTVGNMTAIAAVAITIIIALVGATYTIIQSREPRAANNSNALTHEQMLQLLESRIDERLSRLGIKP